MSLEIFRRNQKVLMAALTLMSMISFVFLDETMKAGTTFLVPLILAVLFGGGAFVWGTRQGKQNEYGAMGAVVGVVLGLVITTFSGRAAHEQVAIAGLSPAQIANLRNRRETANRIVEKISLKANPFLEQFLKMGPQGQDFVQRQLRQVLFGFGYDDPEKDVIFGDLLRREADRMGIHVSDEAVTDFIQIVGNKKLTDDDFNEIKHALHVGDHYIYDLLRGELLAQMAYRTTFPYFTSTPQQRWQDFRKVNVKQSIEATTIPVEAFVKSIPDPSDSQLRDFFSQHAEKFPGLRSEPGFRQPTRARLAYLEADYEAIEAKVTPPTDEEVAQCYEDNKEFYIDRTPPKTEKKEDAVEGDDAKKPEEKKDGDKPDSDKSDESQKDDKPKADSKGSDKPKDDKPADDAKDEKAAPKSDPEGAASDDEMADGPPSTEPNADEKKDTEKKDAPKPDADKPEKKDEPKADSEKPKAEVTPKSDKSGEDEPKSDKPAEDKSEEKPEKKLEPKYKPFEEVKDKIHDDLLRTRTLAEMKKRIESVLGKMRRLGSYTIAEKGSKSYRSPADVASELKELAKSLDLKYVETPLLSAEEFSKSDEYKIGAATDPTDEGVSRQGTISVIQHVFGRGSDSTYTPEVAEDPGTKNRFAYWVIERKEAHVPKFEDDGLRQQVTKAWKLQQAAPKAEERAQALAKLVDDKKLSEVVLAGETTTGDKDDQPLTVIGPSEKFSHFTLQGASVPGVNPLMGGNERLELARIPGLEKLGDDFFSAIDKLKSGETVSIPNVDRSAFIVVHLTEREEVDVSADAPQRGDFMKTWPFSPPANELASIGFHPLRREWMESIERKYNVKWPVK